MKSQYVLWRNYHTENWTPEFFDTAEEMQEAILQGSHAEVMPTQRMVLRLETHPDHKSRCRGGEHE